MMNMTKRTILALTLTAALCASKSMAFMQPSKTTVSSARSLYIDPDMTGTIGPVTPKTTTPARRRATMPQKEYLQQVSNAQEFEKEVKSESNRLVVVRFHAPYCKACKSIAVAYDRLANSLSKQENVKFVDVSIQDTEDFPNLHVPATPYAQIYHPELGLVEQSPIARRQLSTFKKIVKWYVNGMADLPEEFFSNPLEYEPPRMVGVTP